MSAPNCQYGVPALGARGTKLLPDSFCEKVLTYFGRQLPVGQFVSRLDTDNALAEFLALDLLLKLNLGFAGAEQQYGVRVAQAFDNH